VPIIALIVINNITGKLNTFFNSPMFLFLVLIIYKLFGLFF
jgi:hypothetical protein